MEVKSGRGCAVVLGGALAVSLLSSGEARAQSPLPTEGMGRAPGVDLVLHHSGPEAFIGGIAGRVIGAIFGGELARHGESHRHDDADWEWCEEHHQYEPVADDYEEDYEEDAVDDDYAEANDADADEIERDSEYESPGLDTDEAPRVAVLVAPRDVLFDSGSSAISKGAQSQLQRVADSVRDRSDLEVVLRGHSDVSPKEQEAFAISEQRAHEVRLFLADEGVPWQRMRIVGLGTARPVASNETAAGRQRNRRVEILLRERDSDRG